jgi:DNA-binding beta-propeller fold protein YncE
MVKTSSNSTRSFTTSAAARSSIRWNSRTYHGSVNPIREILADPVSFDASVRGEALVLWLSGRYNSEVYAIDTSDGKLLARIPVGRGPHGLCVYPQPGRYSLGHTGVFR